MRRIEYPDQNRMKTLLIEYRSIFTSNLTTMQNDWNGLRDSLRQLSKDPDPQSVYPHSIEDIFVKSYPELVDMYLDYVRIQGVGSKKKDEALHEALKKLFHYSGERNATVQAYQPKIADFFMKHSKELGISVCYYCETSFINTYGFSDIYKDVASFLINADKEMLKRYVRNENNEEYSDKTIADIYKVCHRKDIVTVVDEFDKYYRFKKMKPKKSERIMHLLHNHFDLDHFLPKSICPLVGLSFYNFVPSCSVCNEKLKGADRIGETDKQKLIQLSPTSEQYRFEQEIQIKIDYDSTVQTLRMQEHPDDFRLEFIPKGNVYQEIVTEFRLDERYNYHKQIALKLHDLYQDFAPGYISQLANMFSGVKSKEEIECQIFQGEYTEDNARCFDKLKRDIKRQSGR